EWPVFILPSRLISPPSSPLCFPVASLWALRCSVKAAWGFGGSAARWRPGSCWGGRATHSGLPSGFQTQEFSAEAANPLKTTNQEQFVSAALRMR
ncbi:hypothetical protein XENOCAPTIV_020569, partial [Xenoophorus captivus]